MRIIAIVVGAALAACVPIPDEAPESSRGGTSIISGPFAGLDAGAAELSSLHFIVRGYGSEEVKQVSAAAEDDYGRIMVDTNLFSFMPRGLYEVLVYADQDEYRRKTRQPEWSGGVTVGNAIYTYAGPRMATTLAHEMTHLIFYEYMGRGTPGSNWMNDLRWVNEGLAVYEEQKAAGPGDLFGAVRSNMRQQPIPMDQMMTLAPATHNQYTVSIWYAESESMVRYMIDRAGRLAFSQFLGRLQQGMTPDRAAAMAYAANWRDLGDFYQNWQRSLQ